MDDTARADTVYVSVTGLRVKRPWQFPIFLWHALRSYRQAKSAPGNIRAESKSVDGVHHTLTVWESREAMRAFLYSSAHGQAVHAFPKFATGTTFGFETDRPPDWDEALALWRQHDRRQPKV